jgi:hypothetical protein
MNEKTPGHGRDFNSVWLALGVGAGTALGVAFKNIAIGVGIGAALGVCLAVVIPSKRK